MTEIWVPSSARPKHQCNVCDAKFYETDDYIRHVTKCAEKHREELLELAEEHRAEEAANPLLSGLPFDEEAYEFQRRRLRGE